MIYDILYCKGAIRGGFGAEMLIRQAVKGYESCIPATKPKDGAGGPRPVFLSTLGGEKLDGGGHGSQLYVLVLFINILQDKR